MRRAILTSGIAVGGTRLGGMGLGLLVTLLIGRTLGPEGLGAYGYAVIVLSLLGVPVSYGWGTLLLRQVARALHSKQWGQVRGMMIRGTQFALLLSVAGVFVNVVLSGRVPGLARLSSAWMIALVLAGVLFLDQLSALRLAVLRGLDHPVWGQMPDMLVRPAVIVLTFAALAASLGGGVSLRHAFWALGLGSLASAVIGAAVLYWKQPAPLARAAAEFDTREWLAKARIFAGNSGLLLLDTYTDTLVLGALGTMQDVGLYRIASQVALLSGFVYTALNMMATPRFASLHTAGDTQSLKTSAVFMARLALLGALPLPLLFLFFGRPLVGMIFGPGFEPAVTPMMILFAGQIVNTAAGMASSLLMMSGSEAALLRMTGFAVVLNAIGSVLLIPRFGAVGAAIANATAMSMWNLVIWIYAKRATGVDTSVLGGLLPWGKRESGGNRLVPEDLADHNQMRTGK